MHTYTVREVTQAASNIALLTLEPRTEDDRLTFYPGQYATVGFKLNGRPTPMRCFSIVSSPEDTGTLQFAMRVQGDFTHTVSQLQPGDEAFVHGPFGSFVIDPEYDKRVVMIAGGIGITPFISMLKHAKTLKPSIPITLLYGVRNQRDIAFYSELVQLERQNPNLEIVFFVSDSAVETVPGARFVRGQISEQWLEQVTGGSYQGITYFICGPKSFMQSLQRTLESKHVSPHRIVTESFTQTSKLTLGNNLNISKLIYGLTGAGLVVGFLGIMALDLIRYIPKTTAASATTQTTTETTDTTSTTTPTTDTTTNTTPTTTDTQTQTTTPTYYRPQRSSVS